MIICRSLEELHDVLGAWRDASHAVGFVPTMGALHAGHLSLIDLAQEHAKHVVVSLFVNPTQFAPGEDFASYPRMVDEDLAVLKSKKVACVFLPDVEDIYPDGPQVSVKAGEAAKGLESDFRPHFFDGVCSVVKRLFDLVRPDYAVFGEKDYQQLMVIREMVETQGLDIDILGGAIIRDEYGLALSSRNAYLNARELEIARRLNVIMKNADATAETLLNAGFDKVDYIEERWGRRLAAVHVGKTRLIDNRAV